MNTTPHLNSCNCSCETVGSLAPVQLGKGNEKAKPSSSTSPPAGKGTSQDTRRGPNIALVIARKNSRFCCHFQRVAGSKNIAEIIVFTGRFDVDTLDQVAPGATQPGPQLCDRPWNHLAKERAKDAKATFREAAHLQRSLVGIGYDERYLSVRQKRLLAQLRDGRFSQRRTMLSELTDTAPIRMRTADKSN